MGTHLSCFQSLQKSKIALEQILMDAEIRRKMDSTVRNYVLSEQFWEMLDLITKFLEPMVVALKLFESDTSTLSTVYLHFKKIMNQVNEISCDFSNNIQQLVQKRWEYLYHPIMMAAYMLLYPVTAYGIDTSVIEINRSLALTRNNLNIITITHTKCLR